LLAGAVLSGLCATPSLAQTAPDSPPSPPSSARNSGAANGTNTGQDIIVTANRRPEPVSKVPASISAYDREQMDALNVRSVADIAALTPGIHFEKEGYFSGSNTDLFFRGVTPGGGSATTAVYIDDAPVQVGPLGNSASNPYPLVFDLDRVEVLRGPQGTLFGSSAEGGAIRFITPKPSLDKFSGYARSELAFTDGGAPTYELGVAAGGPIVQDVLGFRASVWARRDGGYVDHAPYPPGNTINTDTNSQNSFATKIALTWQPIENLEVTPSVYYQATDTRDTSGYWVGLSDPGKGVIEQGNVLAQPVHDSFTLSSLTVAYDLGAIKIFSDTTYLRRREHELRDYTGFDSYIIGGPAYAYPTLPGQNAPTRQTNGQNNFTQELRIQSQGAGALHWVGGAFYSHFNQTASQVDDDNYAGTLVDQLTGGKYNIATYFGAPLYNGHIFQDHLGTIMTEAAAFGQVDYNVTPRLKLTAGVRLSRLRSKFNEDLHGPLNGGTTIGDGSEKETAVTPKFGVSYQLDRNSLFYASAAKGFRPGGAELPVPATLCGAGLSALGLTTSPSTYQSDSLWSYEIGAKNNLFNQRLQVSSSAYLIKRSNLPLSLYIPSCGYSFTTNLGSSTIKGFEVSLAAHVTDNLTLKTDLGLTHATYDHDLGGGAIALLAKAGDPAYAYAPFTANVIGEYAFSVVDKHDSYVRFIYEYGSRAKVGLSGTEDPTAFGYDPVEVPNPSTKKLSLLAGFRRNGWQLQVFADNVLDAHPQLGTYHLFTESPIVTAVTFRPRTVGVTVSSSF
jgi:iron complex outermembrane receptor protein